MRSWLRRRLGAEDGFTLMELVITVAILGMITVPLSGVVLAYLRNTVDTQARLTESLDVQFAAAYWQRDVASIGVRDPAYFHDDTDHDGTDDVHTFPLVKSVDVAACSGLPAGASPVVTLAWSGDAPDVDPMVRVTYATRPKAGVPASQPPVYELWRIRCGSQPSTRPLANSLAAVPTVTCYKADGTTTTPCDGGAGAVPALVKLALSVHDSSGHSLNPYTATLSGERRQT